MNLAYGRQRLGEWVSGWAAAWDRFWFAPRLPNTVCALRIAAGLMLLYSHLVLATDLTAFLGDHAWVNNETSRQLHDGTFGTSDWARSYLWLISDPTWLWIHHALAIAVTASFAAGFLTRITAPLAWGLQLMYLHRLTGALFGLDQIVTYSTMYLMLSPCGSCYSVDAWLREKWRGRREGSRVVRWMFPEAAPSVAANIATRLLQLHLCVIYLFGGLSKARGESWWDGTALWYSVGNYEYQSVDMTWMSSFPRLASAMTHATLCWEVFYVALVWPKLTRPIVLTLAVMVHGGIALFLGMITFGVMMIAANMIFVRPETIIGLTRRGASPADAGRRKQDDADRDEANRDAPTPSSSTEAAGASESSLAEREERVRKASRRVKIKSKRLKQREEKYRERVARLKQREGKIKGLIERRRKAKAKRDAQSDSR